MLYVVKPAGPVSDRLDTVLAYALAGTEYCVVTTVAELTAYCRRGSVKKILFAVSLGYGGINLAYAELAAYLALEKDVLQHTCGGVLIDGDSELFTKKVGRELIFLANRAGCLFPGKPLVEATGTLANFAVQAALQGVDTLQAYKLSARRLVRKVTAFSPAPVSAENVLALHASSRSTSNTLLPWAMVRRHLSSEIAVNEISLRNGAVVDCRGCSYETCLHFGEKGDCFYGGLIVDTVYPAVKTCDVMVLICPNYNDSVSANMMAFFNRLTALFRKDSETFAGKRVYGIIVSGYSGGDLVAEQILGAMNCNKNFILPPRFSLTETANDPQQILSCPGIEERAKIFAAQIMNGQA